ncbi:MAG: MFS transporter [Nitriliruptoraceae bacterium]
MRSWFIRLLIMQFTVMMPVNGMRPMVSYRALELGASPMELGIVVAGFSALSFAFAVPLGRWVDRWGEPKFLVLGSFAVGFAALVMVPVANIWLLALIYALLGLGQVTATVGVQTLTANGGRPAQRDGRYGAISISTSASHMVGPPLAGLVFTMSGGSLDTVFLAAAGFVLLAILAGVSLWMWPPTDHARIRHPERSEGPRLGMPAAVATVFRQPTVPHALVVSIAVVASMDLVTAYLPAYGEANGISVQAVGLLLGLRAGATTATRVVILPLVRRFGRRTLLFVGMVAAMLSMLMVPFTATPTLLAVFMAIMGLGLGFGQPLTLAWIAERMPSELRGTAVGVRVTGNRLSQLVVPIVAGAVAGATGIGAVFVVTGVLLGVGSAVVVRAPNSGKVER